MTEEWTNWSGSIRFTPAVLEKPKNEGEVRQIVVRALEQKKKLRIARAGHSSVPLVQTDQILIDLQAIRLGVQYAGTIESNVPVVVQFTKQNTAQCKLALMGTMAYLLE